MKKQAKESVYPYPSRFGSHKSMIAKEPEDSIGAGGMRYHVLCEDEHGIYTTERSRLDNGLADPNRCSESRLGKLFQSKRKDEK